MYTEYTERKHMKEDSPPLTYNLNDVHRETPKGLRMAMLKILGVSRHGLWKKLLRTRSEVESNHLGSNAALLPAS